MIVLNPAAIDYHSNIVIKALTDDLQHVHQSTLCTLYGLSTPSVYIVQMERVYFSTLCRWSMSMSTLCGLTMSIDL